MSEVRERVKALPRSLRADKVIKTPIACRFGWHHWHWDSPASMMQFATCAKCGQVKRRSLW